MKLVGWNHLGEDQIQAKIYYAEWTQDAAGGSTAELLKYIKQGQKSWNRAWLEICARELVERDPVHQPLLDELIAAAARERLALSEDE